MVGALTVTQQTLAIARSPGQSLIVVTTAAGSPSERALALLRTLGVPMHARELSERDRV